MIDKKKKALCHIVRDQLGWDQGTYKDVLRSHAGVGSTGDPKMSLAGFKRFMAHAEKCGFKSTSKKVKPISSKQRLLGKIKALSAAMGLDRKYADGIARKMFGVCLVAWCTADQLRKVVAALMYYKKRQGAKAPVCVQRTGRQRHLSACNAQAGKGTK